MTLHGEIVRAGVVAGGVDTRYLGAGRGTPVLVLSDDPACRTAFLEHLPLGLRVIAPELPPTSQSGAAWPDFPAWFGFFLEALGLWRVAVVADAALAVPSVGMALADADRVTSLVLLQYDLREMGAGENAFGTQVGQLSGGIPLLTADVGSGDVESLKRAIPHIAAFLRTPFAED